MNFDFFSPTQVVFGRGKFAFLGSLTACIGTRALVVTGRGFARSSGLLSRACELLRRSGLPVEVFDGVSANPRSDEVDEAAALARASRCDVVVGLGGGSALDAAKATAVSIYRGSVRELIGTTLPASSKGLPVVAVPTTAGTGSEVTRGAIVTDIVRGFKSGVRGDCVYPRFALVDPELSAAMPRGLAMATAFDALTHAIESYVAHAASALTDALAELSIRLFAEHHRSIASAAPVDPAAHDGMCLMALLGGINVGNASTCLPHRLQQALAAVPRIELSHAQGLAAVYPSWLHFAYPFARSRFDRIGALLGWGEGNIAQSMSQLIGDLGLRPSLAAWGYTEADAGAVLAGVSGNLSNDPMPDIDLARIGAVYAKALHPVTTTGR